MFKQKNYIYIFRLIVIVSIFLPSIGASAAGNLRLENAVDNPPNPYATGEWKADVTITTVDQKSSGMSGKYEIPSCVDNVLVSTLSNSSKMAFLTTKDEPGITKISVGKHIVSTYENEKCTNNSTTIDIKPNTIYIFEVPISDDKTIIRSNSSSISSKIPDQIVPSKSLETVRTGGLNFNLYFLILPLLLGIEIKKLASKIS
jgi:hypothetical protein